MPDLKYFYIYFNAGRSFELMQKTSLSKNAIKMLILNVEFPALLLRVSKEKPMNSEGVRDFHQSHLRKGIYESWFWFSVVAGKEGKIYSSAILMFCILKI